MTEDLEGSCPWHCSCKTFLSKTQKSHRIITNFSLKLNGSQLQERRQLKELKSSKSCNLIGNEVGGSDGGYDEEVSHNLMNQGSSPILLSPVSPAKEKGKEEEGRTTIPNLSSLTNNKEKEEEEGGGGGRLDEPHNVTLKGKEEVGVENEESAAFISAAVPKEEQVNVDDDDKTTRPPNQSIIITETETILTQHTYEMEVEKDEMIESFETTSTQEGDSKMLGDVKVIGDGIGGGFDSVNDRREDMEERSPDMEEERSPNITINNIEDEDMEGGGDGNKKIEGEDVPLPALPPVPPPSTTNAYNCRNRSKFHKCGNCGKMFGQLTSLKWHEKEHLLESSKNCECVECGKCYTTLASYQKHLRSHTKCILCGKVISKAQKERLGRGGGLDVNVCIKCKKDDLIKNKPGRSIKLKGHVFGNGDTDNDDEILAAALSSSSSEEDEVNDEVMEQEPAAPSNASLLLPNNNSGFACRYCFQTFPNSALMKKHEGIVHYAERPYKCTFCPARFKVDHHRTRHELVHTGVKEHHCHICGAAFNQRYRLTNHITKLHSNNLSGNNKEEEKVELDEDGSSSN